VAPGVRVIVPFGNLRPPPDGRGSVKIVRVCKQLPSHERKGVVNRYGNPLPTEIPPQLKHIDDRSLLLYTVLCR
jgi:hypothetical protein